MKSKVTRKFGEVEKISFSSCRYGFNLAAGSGLYSTNPDIKKSGKA